MKETPNLKYIEGLAAGSKEFKQNIIDIVKREFPEEKAVFLENYNNSNYLETAENVHKLKHKIGILGLEDGYQVAVDFENELKGNKFTLYSEFMLILEVMEAFLKKQ